MPRLCFRLNLFVGLMMLIIGTAHAQISGRFETLVEQNNRELQGKNSSEEWLDLIYDNPSSGLRSGLSLAFSQREDEQDKALTQFYAEKTLNSKRSLIKLGRQQRSDALGFYTLDGLLLKQTFNSTALTVYGGVPSRLEGFRAIEGDALYGFNIQTSKILLTRYSFNGRLGGQHLKKTKTENRINIGGRGIHQQTPTALSPSAFSFSGSYLVDDNRWESIQFNAYRDFENKTRLRLDYETYQPNKDELTFKDRFYSLYARGRQSQFKVGYQINQGRQYTWEINGRQVTREFGSNGYGAVATMNYRSNQGWRSITQLDHLTLANERLNSLYFENEKSFSSMMRGTFSSVLQHQQKQLTGDNISIGIEARLSRRVKLKSLPSAFWFSAEATYLHNSRLTNEYRIAMRLLHHFDDRTRKSLQ